MSGLSTRMARMTNTPSMNPDQRVTPPLETFTMVGPIVPAPAKHAEQGALGRHRRING